ncbi:MAG: mechanosensitive ion channel family protein [Bacteroidota bacterium]|nr:mechanosensitive ion channel family protein [Bacteroidota bacterium]
MHQLLDQEVLGNTLASYVFFLGYFIACIVVIFVFRKVVLHKLKAWAERTETTLDDFLIHSVERFLVPALYFGALYASVQTLNLHRTLSRILDTAGIIIITILAIRSTTAVIEYSFQEHWLKKSENETRHRSLRGLMPAINVLVWGLGIVFLLDNLGVRVSAVVAGLGIGGVAVALAAQAVLKDLFSYFAILLDRPFEVDDFIIIDEYMGSIEHVGIKTTRIRSLSGEQLIVSNADLTSSRLRNYKRMEKRRVVFQFGILYETPQETVEHIPGIVERIIRAVDQTAFDRAHFAKFGDSALIFEVVYYVLSSDYNLYMDIQQKINFALMKELRGHNVSFAYPTQTLYLTKSGD